MPIDWSNPKEKIAEHFTVREALYLPRASAMHVPNGYEKTSILDMALHMDRIREFLGAPIIVHCWIRPEHINIPGNPLDGDNYNELVGGSYKSWHIRGAAVDFHVKGFEGALGCEEIRTRLLPKLEEFNIRMEDHRGAWVHVDRGVVVRNRYFKP